MTHSTLAPASMPWRTLRRLRTAAAVLTSGSSTAGVPSDLLRQASRRLQVMSLMAATLWVVGPALQHLALHLANPADPRWKQLLPVDAVALVSSIASVALWAHLRRRERDARRVIDLALLYLVVSAFAVGVLSHWEPLPASAPVVRPMITWIGPVTLMLAAIVPVAPARMLAAGFVAAAMGPLGMWIMAGAGLHHEASAADLAVMHFPDFLLIGVAGVISRVVTGLGRQLGHARELGSYRLGALLGEGGMGRVYRATHRMLARPAAVKLIRSDLLAAGDPAVARIAGERFRREAEAAAGLRSPHTVELYDFGVADDGTLFTVMELLDGMTLQELVDRHGPMPVGRVLYVLRQVCESLEEAHATGLVHRDIKPGNIHVGRLGLRHDFVKVLDFGLVKSAAPAATESLATLGGAAIGTPAYLAPELASSDEIDGRADLYALGCVAHFLLTGQLVFEGATPLHMVARHLQDRPPAPSSVAGPAIPAALDRLVLACLEKSPADRPQNAAELARLLAAVPAEPWGEEQAADWWERHVRAGSPAVGIDRPFTSPTEQS